MLVGVVLSLPLPLAAQTQTLCNSACVENLVNTYVAGLLRHEPKGLPLASGVRITENGRVTNAGEGVWRTITEQGGYHDVFVDDGLQSAVFFGAFREGDEPLLLAIRFKLDGRLISEVENLVSRYDERNSLIRRHQLTEPNPAYHQSVPRAQQLSGQTLVDAGNAYFDGIASSTHKDVPLHRECNRRENGVLLLQNRNPQTEDCPAGFERFNYITAVRDRRVAVVNREKNLVLIWAFFDVPGNITVEARTAAPSDTGAATLDTRRIPRSLYIAELFHLQDGLIRDIEAIMFNLDLGAKSGWD